MKNKTINKTTAAAAAPIHIKWKRRPISRSAALRSLAKSYQRQGRHSVARDYLRRASEMADAT